MKTTFWKRSTLLLGSGAIAFTGFEHVQSDKRFAQKIQLVFPTYPAKERTVKV